MKRYLLMLAAGALTLSANAQDVQLHSFNVGNDAFVNSMSRNGKWATYEKQADATVTLGVDLVDLTTGKFVTYTPEKMINYQGKQEEFVDGSYSRGFGVSDDGKTIYGTVNGYPGYFTVDDLTWHCLSMGSKTDNRNLAGAVYGASADGRLLAGWFSGTSLTELKSALWENGEIKKLPNLPTYKDLYDLGIIDTADYAEEKGMTPNYTYRTLSADGTKLVIGIDHNKPDWGCSYGVYDLEKETFSFILADPKVFGHSFTDSAYMSDNGEWVTGNMYFVGTDESGAEDKEGVYRYQVSTGKLEVFNDLADRDMLATAIDNNGVIFCGTPASQPMRNLMVRSENLWVDLGKILDQKYDYNFYQKTGFENSGYAIGVSADCKTLLSQAEFRGGAYSLTLPVDFATAAKGTSLLTEYAVSPLPGKKFAKLSKMMVRFSYGVKPAEGAKVKVTDNSGNVVGESTDLVSFSSQNLLYTVVFPDIAMEEGKKYTVTIPAGSFFVPETTMGNPEITVEYEGRANEAVKALSISPEEESYINVFSYSSPLTVTFDADLTLSTAVQPKLYEEGKAAALANLSVTVDGNKMIVYPASERRLAKDRVYRIEIPANIVADLGGAGGNEPMQVTYNGAFVPTPVTDPARPFFEDFSSPNEALYHFLLIDGDKKDPTEVMQSYGFDAVNTPWNFSIRDEGAYDYCAASHSCYVPAGQSDDWMMLPQIQLNDADYYLTFKAQSEKKNKTDKLSIKVWEYDDVIGSLDEDMLKKVKKECVTLKELTLTPAAQEGVLEGNWQSYDLPLADFAGKKVYIAFVNENKDQSMVFVDDIAVEYRGAYTLTVASENNLLQAKTTDITAFVNVNAAGPFTALEATVKVPALNYSETIKLDDLNLTSGSSKEVKFTDVPLEQGVVNRFTVETSMGGITQSYSGSIVNQAFEIQKRVLIEEGTGMWCGNCPLGEVAIEHLEETMPENVAIISVHNGDSYALTDYDQLLALGGYPNGRVNRSDNVYSPMYADETTGDKTFTSPEGDKTFMDAVLAELASGTEGEIKIKGAVYHSADSVVNIPVSVRFSVSRENAIYSVYTCVLEDGLTGRQTNYFTGQTSETLSWWTAQPKSVSYTYKNVARAMVGGFYGISGRVPTTVEAGVEYKTSLPFPLPPNVANADNMHFVVALIDATTGKVVNSDVCYEFEVNPIPGSGVEEVAAELPVRMSVAGGRILVNGEEGAEVYNMSGMRVRNEGVAPGIYIVRKQMADGRLFTGRIIVK